MKKTNPFRIPKDNSSAYCLVTDEINGYVVELERGKLGLVPV